VGVAAKAIDPLSKDFADEHPTAFDKGFSAYQPS